MGPNKIDFFCPRWGFESIDWEIFLRRVKRAGYIGIDWFPFGEECDHVRVVELLKNYNLQHCIVMTVKEPFTDIDTYLKNLTRDLSYLSQLGSVDMQPQFISAQVGREFFVQNDIDNCVKACFEVEQKSGVKIYQETHRNKWPYAVHVVNPVLERHPSLRLTLDISHWFCVSESYLEDQQKAVQLAIERTSHIHARVGSIQGPQVLDPALKQFKQALQEHLKVWDYYVMLINVKKERCTVTPEFGPPPYMVTKRQSSSARKKQWRLNLWMKELLEDRYSNNL